ncbi:MAG TPA: hypothetical protein VMY42_17490 [Thermoguttaceae bacterium]|nr:hypothetical protein [Thermoguttaceae bacterium]
MTERRIYDDEFHAQFATFSRYRRRRLLDHLLLPGNTGDLANESSDMAKSLRRIDSATRRLFHAKCRNCAALVPAYLTAPRRRPDKLDMVHDLGV